MTAQEKLHAVETAIRKALPRLMEVRRGCILKNSNVWVRLLSDKGDYYEVMGWDTIYQELKKEWLSEYEIIGHDILLSDVLEWSSKTFKNFRKLLIDDDGILYKFLINGMFGDAGGMYWDLSKPRLADQSEKLWAFLYNLIKDNE